MEPDPLGQPASDQGDVRAAARLPLPVPRARARRGTLSEPRERRFAFGNVAETYDRVRPPYYKPILDRVQEALALEPEAHVLDLGAGTGRLTRELARRFASVVAVEPDNEMRALIERGTVLAGRAEAIPLPDGSVDCVFAGEAFHWFDAPRAIDEIGRVLVPRGGLVIIWTHWWETEPPLPAEALDLFREAQERAAAQQPEPWDEAFDDSLFEPLRREDFGEELTVNIATLLAMYSTTSSIAMLPEVERAALFDRARPLLGDSYRLPIKHGLIWTRLRADS